MKPDPRIIQWKLASEAGKPIDQEERRKMVRRIYGSDESPLRFIIKSNGNVIYAPKKWWEFWK